MIEKVVNYVIWKMLFYIAPYSSGKTKKYDIEFVSMHLHKGK